MSWFQFSFSYPQPVISIITKVISIKVFSDPLHIIVEAINKNFGWGLYWMAFIKKVLPEIISAFSILRDVRSVLVDYGKNTQPIPFQRSTVIYSLTSNPFSAFSTSSSVIPVFWRPNRLWWYWEESAEDKTGRCLSWRDAADNVHVAEASNYRGLEKWH